MSYANPKEEEDNDDNTKDKFYSISTPISTHPHINLAKICPIHSDVRLGFCVSRDRLNPQLMSHFVMESH